MCNILRCVIDTAESDSAMLLTLSGVIDTVESWPQGVIDTIYPWFKLDIKIQGL